MRAFSFVAFLIASVSSTTVVEEKKDHLYEVGQENVRHQGHEHLEKRKETEQVQQQSMDSSDEERRRMAAAGLNQNLYQEYYYYGFYAAFFNPNLLAGLLMFFVWITIFCSGFCCLYQVATPETFVEKSLNLAKEF